MKPRLGFKISMRFHPSPDGPLCVPRVLVVIFITEMYFIFAGAQCAESRTGEPEIWRQDRWRESRNPIPLGQDIRQQLLWRRVPVVLSVIFAFPICLPADVAQISMQTKLYKNTGTHCYMIKLAL